MLTVWRRRRSKCPHRADRYYRKCRCACWRDGTVEAEYIRRSVKTRSWERAAEIVRQIKDGKREPSKPKSPIITEAISKFKADAEHGRKLTAATLKKYRVLFDQLQEFCGKRGAVELSEMDVDFAREFRAWSDGPASSVKKLERFRAFCRWRQAAGWMEKNPASSVARPVGRQCPTMPLSEKDIGKALETCDDLRWHALIQVLRWSGLRIGDAMKLTPEKLDGNRLVLRTAKTGTAVNKASPPRSTNRSLLRFPFPVSLGSSAGRAIRPLLRRGKRRNGRA
ncbi:MAG TPA: phage integrase SAM-like domain-containing protein [Verrucomicrobiae bacterium]|nr:phage integrase SAM-like domain-containing protein [Verrucomicrobiae bacterium]